MDPEGERRKWTTPMVDLAHGIKGRGNAFFLEPALDVELERVVDDDLGRNRLPCWPMRLVPSDDGPIVRSRYERLQRSPVVERL